MKLRVLAAVAAIAFASLGGCMTSGVKFTMAEVASLQPGVTTIDEAIRVLGQPTARSSYGDGGEFLQWQYTEVVYIAGESRHVGILFDRNGRMVRVAHQYQNKF